PLGAVGRLAIQQRLKTGKPTVQAYPEFVKRLSTLIEEASEREAFAVEALRLVPSVEAAPPMPPAAKAAALVSTPPATQKLVPPPVSAQNAPNLLAPLAPTAQRSALPVPPRPASVDLTATPLPAPLATEPVTKVKKYVMYRGRKIEVDE
ncbi:MAG TPA: hypothetical protein VGC79_17975, partial [Polyangiaceae bacterium]